MTTAVFAAPLRPPPAATELYEYSLRGAVALRCEAGCGRCEACSVSHRLRALRQWFSKAGDRTRRTFVLGLCERLRSASLLRQLLLLLRPLSCKDFMYARVRPEPGLAGDSATMSGDRALSPRPLHARITDTWQWFEAANYWSKVNFMLALLHDCEAHLLHLVAIKATTLLASELPNFKFQADYATSPIASCCDETGDSSDLDLFGALTPSLPPTPRRVTAGTPLCRLAESRCTKPEVEDGESESGSLDPACLVVPSSVKAYSGVVRHRDFVRCLPVHLSKSVLGYLDQVSLFNCVCVSRHWRMLVEEVHREFYLNQNLWEEVMLMQGAAAKSCNPVYARDVDVVVPNVVPGTRQTVRTADKTIETVYKSEVNLMTAYSGYETRRIIMEERNVFCGAYNVMVLANEAETRDVHAMHTDGGSLVALGGQDRKIHFLSGETGKGTGPVISGHAGSIRCLVLSQQRGLVLSGSYDTSIRCWSLQSGKCERILRGHADTVTCMKLFEDHLVSGARDHMCKVWLLGSGKCVQTFRHRHPVTAVALSADICISGCDGGVVKVWDLDTGQRIKKLTGHHGMVTAISFDMWHIVTASKDGYALAWSAQGDHTRCLTALRHPTEVLCLEFMYLRVITGCDDGKLRIWNMVTGQCMRIMRGNSRSDSIKQIIAIDNRVTIHTTNNLLVLSFERVAYDYSLESDRMPSLTKASLYSDQPLRTQPYAYVRAQRMRRAGASNTLIVRRGACAQAVVAQTRHSARGLSQGRVAAAKRIQSAGARLQTGPASPRPPSVATSSGHPPQEAGSSGEPSLRGVVVGQGTAGRRVSWGAFESVASSGLPLSLPDTKALLRSQMRARAGVLPPEFVRAGVSALQAAMPAVGRDVEGTQRAEQVRQEQRAHRPASSPSRVDPRAKVSPPAAPALRGVTSPRPAGRATAPSAPSLSVTRIVTEFTGSPVRSKSASSIHAPGVRTSIPAARLIRPHTAAEGERGGGDATPGPPSPGAGRAVTSATHISCVPMLMYPRDLASRLAQLKRERTERQHAAPPGGQPAHHITFTFQSHHQVEQQLLSIERDEVASRQRSERAAARRQRASWLARARGQRSAPIRARNEAPESPQ